MKKQNLKAIGGLLSGLLLLCTTVPIIHDNETVEEISVITANATNSASDIISVASAEVGNGLSKYTQWNGKIGNTYTYAWCAAFTSWCAYQAGVTSVSKTASCYNQYYNSSGKKHWVANDKSYVPQAGDLIYFDWSASGSTNTNFDHVGIVVSYNSSTKKITTIEGNYGSNGSANNKVTKTTREYNNKVKAFLTPNYVNPNPWTKETGWNLPVTLTAPSKISNLYNLNGGSDSGHYIDKGDKCTINEVWVDESGVKYVHVQYPTSSENRWSYAKLSDLPISPTNVKLAISKTSFVSTDTITLTPSATNAVNYYLAIYDSNGKKVYDKDNITGSHSLKASTLSSGEYTVWVSAKNSVTSADSNHITFKVVTLPEWSKIEIDKTTYKVGEAIQCTVTSEKDCWYSIGVADSSGKRIVQKEIGKDKHSKKQQTSFSIDKAGNYYCWVSAYNDAGYKDSTIVNFNVVPDAPIGKFVSGTSDSVKFSWGKVSGASSYKITWRSSDTDEYSVLEKSITALNYTKDGLEPNKKYFYLCG